MKMFHRTVIAYTFPVIGEDDNGDYKVVGCEYTTDARLAKRYAARERKVVLSMPVDALLNVAKKMGWCHEVTDEDYNNQVGIDEAMKEIEEENNHE